MCLRWLFRVFRYHGYRCACGFGSRFSGSAALDGMTGSCCWQWYVCYSCCCDTDLPCTDTLQRPVQLRACHDHKQFTRDGYLHVHGRVQPLVHDFRMRQNIVRTLLEQVFRRKMAAPYRHKYHARVLHLRHNSHFR